MGNIVTTKRLLNDDVDGGQVLSISLVAKTADLNTIAERMVLTVNYTFDVNIGDTMHRSKTRMLVGPAHPALTDDERVALRQIMIKLVSYELDNDPRA